ncbi:M4 family metallopeptidase [Anthocerotibacter panamensis]|uniref:M4 family metallopeptidase n=1 Tax=Anthocerotibacter panamensis TaxID=2857077 RepID=UPI001C407BEF|nr:M4 family metallopeptidase [Anthocerotibacter panamensis]
MAATKDSSSAKNLHQCRNPLCCIISPHMLGEIVQRGNAEQRSWAYQTSVLSENIRGQRQALGPLLAARSTPSAPGKARRVYDSRQGMDLPGVLVRSEGDPAHVDPAVNEAYDGAGATYDLYHEVYDRRSVDDRDMDLVSTVHYSQKYDNAFWNGTQMVYGDGDGQLFQRFTIALDIIGHELTHGVTQYEAALVYQGQSGALNESFSDVFGSLVKQRALKQTVDQADWLIGAGLLAPGVQGMALRSLKAPGTAYDDPVLGKDPQPSHLRDLYKGSDDNGGVHINSGIPNHAFFLAAVTMGGFAWEKAGRIWYLALRDRLRSTSNFKRAALATIQVAGELYGTGSLEQKAVQDAWHTVGVTH